MLPDFTQEDIGVRVCILVAVHVVVYAWTRFVVAPARVGWPRLVRAIPLLPVLAVPSTLFDSRLVSEFILSVFCTVNFLWLSVCKILAFCCNRGPLTKSYDSGSTAAFVLSAVFTISVAFEERRVKEDEQNSKERRAYRDARFSVIPIKGSELYSEAGTLILRIIGKLSVMTVAGIGYQYFDRMDQPFLRSFCLSWLAYGNASGFEDVVGLLLVLTINLKLEDNFNCPWRAQSITEFWSRRYNLVFADTLRIVSYEPICEGCWVRGKKYFDRPKPAPVRRMTGVSACFLLSTVFHIFAFMYGYSSPFAPLHGLFFVANGLAVILEGLMKIQLRKSKYYKWIVQSVPSWLMTVYACSSMAMLAHYLFWPELIEAGYAGTLVKAALSNMEPLGLNLAH